MKASARICSCGRRVEAEVICQCRRARNQEARAKHDSTRLSSYARGYDKDWQSLRADYLASYPNCCVDGCKAEANNVDHIQSITDRPDLRLTWSNLRSMCHSHHCSHTARTQGFARPRGGYDKTLPYCQQPSECQERQHYLKSPRNESLSE